MLKKTKNVLGLKNNNFHFLRFLKSFSVLIKFGEYNKKSTHGLSTHYTCSHGTLHTPGILSCINMITQENRLTVPSVGRRLYFTYSFKL